MEEVKTKAVEAKVVEELKWYQKLGKGVKNTGKRIGNWWNDLSSDGKFNTILYGGLSVLTVVGAVSSSCKDAKLKRENERKIGDSYHTYTCNRKLTERDYAIIQDRWKKGENLGAILIDMGLLN